MISFLLNIHINTHAHTNKEHPEECKSSVYSHFLDSDVTGNILVVHLYFFLFHNEKGLLTFFLRGRKVCIIL